MSYLIGLYVFYHGNNLPAFGFIPGTIEESEKNTGLHRSREELYELLPKDVADVFYEEEITPQVSYEDILRQAIMNNQSANARLMNSSLNVNSGYTKEETTTFEDGDYDIDLDFFNELNGFNSSQF